MVVTTYHIAEKIGMTQATVSRALRNDPLISENTRKKIQDMARTLGYRPNAVARGLRRGITETIGLVIPNRRYSYFADIAIAVEKYARQHKSYVITVFGTDNEEIGNSHLKELDALSTRQVDGMIIAPPGVNPFVAQAYNMLIQRGIPLVLIDQAVEGVEISFVGTDDISGAKDAVEYLIKKGHRRIAHISGAFQSSTGKHRLEGYRLALEEAGIGYDPNLVFGKSYAPDDVILAIRKFLAMDPLPTAVFCANDLMAAEIYKACYEKGLRIPDDLSVVGYCGLIFCEYLAPPLTTMVQPADVLAEKAMELLFEQIKQEPQDRIYREVNLKAELCERKSVLAIR